MTLLSQRIVPVVMCGGAGTRLWPASRESMPKQFLPLIGIRSTFQAAVERVKSPDLFFKPVVIAHQDARFTVAEQMAEIGFAADIILEPQRRDSAAAVAVAAVCAAKRHPHAMVLVSAADHIIPDNEAFSAACQDAAASAQEGAIMTLGVSPAHASTSYGYIKPGAPMSQTKAYWVDRFVEKPDSSTAQRYLEEGYLWNSGNFLFRADLMLGELNRHEPAILAAAREAVERARIDLDFIRLDEEAFALAPKTSFDYAVMERTDRAGVLPVTFAWSDVGSWGSLWEIAEHDSNGNVLRGTVEVSGTRNSLVHSDGILTAVVGVDDAVVVTTPDAVLVTTRSQSGEVKNVVAALRTNGHREADEHIRMYRPWGWYQRVDVGSRFQVKRIMVKPGGRLSLQKHYHRAEHWVVVRGTAEVTVNGAVQELHENEAAYIPIGAVHRLVNPGRIPLEIIEVQVGPYTGEDDIIRMEDVYGRSEASAKSQGADQPTTPPRPGRRKTARQSSSA